MHNNEFFVGLIRFSSRIQGLLAMILWVLLIYGFDEPYTAGLTIIAALVHEGGHFLFLTFKSGHSFKAVGRLSGPRILRSASLSYIDDILLYTSGSLFNILFALLLLPFSQEENHFGVLITINLITAFSNLLPLAGHDGYGIITTLLRMHSAPTLAYTVLKAVSVTLSALGCFLALFLLLKIGEGYWLFAVFCFSLFCELLSGSKGNY